MLTAVDTYNHYNAISRQRALTHRESLALERAIKQIDAAPVVERPHTPWSTEDTATLLTLRDQGLSFTEIGIRMKRTKSAVFRACQKARR